MSSTSSVSRNPAVTERGSAISSATRRFFSSPLWMVLVAFALRVICIFAEGLYKFKLIQWVDLEVANIGRSLALGQGFSSPWIGSIGPTAWCAPVYPWLVSLAFRCFGIFSHGAALAMLLLNSAFSALTCWTIYRTARLLFSEKVAVWSGWCWALLPYAIYWPVIWIWDTALSTFLLSLLFMLTIEMDGDTRLWSWFRYGILWGFVALTNTSLLAWLPFSGCWLAYRIYRTGKSFLAPVVVSALVFWMVIAPWLVRNYLVLDHVIFIRGDLGSELRTGNNPLATGHFVPNYRAGSNVGLTVEYNHMGEVAWVAEQGDLARKWIAENTQKYFVLSCRRVLLYWYELPEKLPFRSLRPLLASLMLLPFGGVVLAVYRRIRGAFLFVSLVVFYPLIYYFTFTTPRYRHPIEPELVILAVWFVVSSANPAKSGLVDR